MYPVLFIGGSRDGEREIIEELLPDIIVTVFKYSRGEVASRDELNYGDFTPKDFTDSSITAERYLLLRVKRKVLDVLRRTGDSPEDEYLHLYVEESVTHPLKRLVDGYTPRKTQR